MSNHDDPIRAELWLLLIMFLVFAFSASIGWVFLNAKMAWPVLENERGVTAYFPYYVAIAFLVVVIPARLLNQQLPSRSPLSSRGFVVLACSGLLLALVDRFSDFLTVLNPIINALPSVPNLLGES